MEKKTLTTENAIALWRQSILSISGNYEQSPEVLKIGDTVIGTLGNFSASIGKAKSKKTFNVSAIVAAALSNSKVLHYTAKLPAEKRNILYIDTEQSSYHCHKVMQRILRLAGLPCDQDCEQLQFLTLRKYTPEDRIAIIETAIRQTNNLGFVVIDGIRDLLYDINSPSESTCVISKLMQWTDEKQIHLHTILHQNKGDENARGHIGTELSNKAETIMQVEVDKDNKNISVVEAIHIRSMDFSPFAFYINDDALPELVENYAPKEKKAGRPKKGPFDPDKDIPESIHYKALTGAFLSGSIERYEDVIKALQESYKTVGFRLNYNKTVRLIKFLRDKGIIVHVDGRYTSNSDYCN